MSGEPTFLMGVGATKAGTSWLYRYLAGHPDCHLRSIKELHYFDMIETRGLQRWRDRETARMLSLRARQEDGRGTPYVARVVNDLKDWVAVLGKGPRGVSAYIEYLTQGRGDRRLVADITPAYATLSVDGLRRMAGIAPDVRVLYLLRDPVARMWSAARMIGRRRATDKAQFPAQATGAMAEMIARVEAGHTNREDYAGTVRRLTEAVPPHRLMVQLLDDLLSAPGLKRLCAFLGIKDHPGDFDTRQHAGLPLDLPEDLRLRAQRALRPQYEFAATLFPDLPDSWRRNMTEVHG